MSKVVVMLVGLVSVVLLWDVVSAIIVNAVAKFFATDMLLVLGWLGSARGHTV